METLTLLIAAFALSSPFFGVAWIYRYHKRLNTVNGVFAIVIVVFTAWHYYLCGMTPDFPTTHNMITAIFVLITTAVNSYCSTGVHSKINVHIDRRACTGASNLAPVAERRHIKTGRHG